MYTKGTQLQPSLKNILPPVGARTQSVRVVHMPHSAWGCLTIMNIDLDLDLDLLIFRLSAKYYIVTHCFLVVVICCYQLLFVVIRCHLL